MITATGMIVSDLSGMIPGPDVHHNGGRRTGRGSRRRRSLTQARSLSRRLDQHLRLRRIVLRLIRVMISDIDCQHCLSGCRQHHDAMIPVSPGPRQSPGPGVGGPDELRY
jgi:hypothetical protein